MVGPEWRIVYSGRAQKGARNLSAVGLKSKAQVLLRILERAPLATPPPCEKLVGNLTGYFSRRINIHKILEEEKTVLVLRMWSHYE